MIKQILLPQFELFLVPQKSGNTHKGKYQYQYQSFSKMSAWCLTAFNEQSKHQEWLGQEWKTKLERNIMPLY